VKLRQSVTLKVDETVKELHWYFAWRC
jgi:hypothetical protein